ncbi:hypothetical protein [Rhodococcus opacus]|uniref:hypothetical protein n=1 Tax=Rhodococcus opacus TaxID=37919 RepID=UPI001F57A3D9|nr:hypothetical protein [Rhodococcus opacus]UNN05228.1 hypothetical protein MOO23_40125 [Rhodococcus opacus]
MTTSTAYSAILSRLAVATLILAAAFALVVGGLNPARASAAPLAATPAAASTLAAHQGVGMREVQRAANPWDVTARKTAAFTTCIFGVGVPIGIGIGIATNPQVWAWVLGRGAWPASVGGTAAKYLDVVKRNCAYALR